MAEFCQGGGPVQPPPLCHRPVDFAVLGLGQLGEPGRGLAGQVQSGRSPITHRPRPFTRVDLETVQLADQDDLPGPEPGDLLFTGDQFQLPRVDLLIDSSGLTPPIHNPHYERSL